MPSIVYPQTSYQPGAPPSIDKSNLSEAQIRELLIECAFDPARWCREFLPVWEPDEWQEEAHKALVDHRYLALSTGTGPGKTFWTAATIFWFLTTRAPEAQVLCTAPTKTQLENGLWPALARIQRSSKLLQRLFEATQTKIFLRGYKNECFVVAQTARIQPGKLSPEGLQGIHAKHILVFVDEASGIADQAMAAVSGAMTHGNAYMILAANPNRCSGHFYRVITDKRKQVDGGGKFYVIRVNCEHSKYSDVELRETIANNFGRDSNEYRVKVLGLPPLGDVQSLITPEQVYAAHLRKDVPAAGAITVSCDPARYGDDPSIFYVRQGWRFLRRVVVNKMSTTDLAKVGWDLVDEYHADYFNIEVNGLGAGTVDRAREIFRERRGANDGRYFGVVIESVDMGGKAKNNTKFVNRRSELYWQLRETIEFVSLVDIKNSDLLDEELSTTTYKWSLDDARIQIPSKDQLRAELGRSPNDADSIVVNLFTELAENVKVNANVFNIGSRTATTTPQQTEPNSVFVGGGIRSRSSTGIFSFGSDGGGAVGRKRLAPLNNFDFDRRWS